MHQHHFETFIPTANIKATRFFNEIGLGYFHHDIMDLKQELMIVAWLAIGTFKKDRLCSLNTWVNKKMDFFILDFKREYVKRRIKIEYVGDIMDLQLLADTQHASNAGKAPMLDMEAVYAQLDTKMQKILKLYLDGYTQQEIASQLEYKDNSGVAKQLMKIRKLLSGVIRNHVINLADHGKHC